MWCVAEGADIDHYFAGGAVGCRQPVRPPQGGDPRCPSGPLPSLLSSCGHPASPPQGLDPSRSGAGSALVPLTCPAFPEPGRRQPPPQLQGSVEPPQQHRSEGRVRTRPPVRHSSLQRPRGPTTISSLHLSSSSGAPLYPRLKPQGPVEPPRQLRSEGRVRGRPPEWHSSPQQPRGPAVIRGLRLSSSLALRSTRGRGSGLKHSPLQGRSSITAPTGSLGTAPGSAAPRRDRHPRSERMNPLGPRKGCFSRIGLQALSELRVYASDILPSLVTPPFA
ncbi:hypothetical protein NDU88_006323 [Pleurodeles waltl]|uniref:Uncharacterized protein n=1 Tax=Pleurodeles waltl TaxID=8319 RepID=A0AAV7PLG8_PLEWA|nr:hypothetical protein NDU88_006323 [Pleurodeles waltl]